MLRTMLAALVTLSFGATLSLAADGDKKPAGKAARGVIASVDAEKGVLNLKAGEGGGTKAVTITKETKVLGADGKELADGLKNPGFKADAAVSITTDAAGKVTEVRVAGAKKGDKK